MPNNTTSDIDLFYASPHTSPEAVDRVRLGVFIRNFHMQYGRTIDEEVPYENKTVYGFDELDRAIDFGGFVLHDNKLFVPKVIKDTEFLNSEGIKLRLALNALTTPNLIMSSELSTADRYAQLSKLAMTILGMSLVDTPVFSNKEVIEALTVSDEGEVGEMFLGYKLDHEPVKRKLDEFVNYSLTRLSRDGHIEANENNYSLTGQLMPSVIMSHYR